MLYTEVRSVEQDLKKIVLRTFSQETPILLLKPEKSYFSAFFAKIMHPLFCPLFCVRITRLPDDRFWHIYVKFFPFNKGQLNVFSRQKWNVILALLTGTTIKI